MSRLALAADGDRVVVDPASGGRIASLVIGGTERLLDEPGDASAEARRVGWGCYLMAPWAGRLAGASFEWDGRERHVPRTHGAHAIHGVALDASWEVLTHDEAVVELRCDLREGGWPLDGAVRQRVELSPGRLSLLAEVSAGPDGMPAAVGWHPWFRRPERGDLRLAVDAAQVLRTDESLIPDGRRAAADGHLDLRGGPALGPRRLDHSYLAVREPVRVRWPDLELTMTSDLPEPTYVVHTPPHGVCVEPQSAWPNAPALHLLHPTGLRELGAGDSLVVGCIWTWHRVQR